MKLYISADLEGIGGVVDIQQTRGGDGKEYQEARLLMTEEVNAIARGAFSAGIKEVLVNDSHGGMRNLILDKIHPGVQIITGSSKPFSMMEGLDSSFSGVAFVGYHAKAGTANSIIDHTYNGRCIYRLLINGMEVGEAQINGAIAGYHGVPVIFLSGDRNTVEHTKKTFSGITTVAVKRGISRFSALSLSPAGIRNALEEGIKKAVYNKGKCKPFKFKTPVRLHVEFQMTAQADWAMLIPSAKRTGDRSVEFIHKDYLTAFKVFQAMISLAWNITPK